MAPPPRGVSAPWPAMAAPNSGPPPGPRACPVLPEAPLLLRGRPHGQVCRERSHQSLPRQPGRLSFPGGPVCRPACAQRGARKPATGRPAAAVSRPDRGADGQVGRRRCAPCGPRAPPSRGLSSGSASLWLHVVNVTLFRVVSANGVMALLCTRKLRKLL